MVLGKTFPQCPKIENLTPMIIGGYSILFTPGLGSPARIFAMRKTMK